MEQRHRHGNGVRTCEAGESGSVPASGGEKKKIPSPIPGSFTPAFARSFLLLGAQS